MTHRHGDWRSRDDRRFGTGSDSTIRQPLRTGWNEDNFQDSYPTLTESTTMRPVAQSREERVLQDNFGKNAWNKTVHEQKSINDSDEWEIQAEPEDQESRREREWLKTQRVRSDDMVITPPDELPTDVPKVLRPKLSEAIKDIKSVDKKAPRELIHVADDDLVLSKTTRLQPGFPDISQYEQYLKSEIMAIKREDSFTLCPTAVKTFHCKEQEEYREVGYFVKVLNESFLSDPLQRVVCTVPDKMNYQVEKDKMLERFAAKDVNLLTRTHGCDFSLNMKPGGLCEIQMIDGDDENSVIYNATTDPADVATMVQTKLNCSVKIELLSQIERESLLENFSRMFSPTACRLYFENANDAQNFVDQHSKLSMITPKCVLEARATLADERSFCGTQFRLELRWYTKPSAMIATVEIHEAADYGRAEDVLRSHGFYNHEERFKTGNRMLLLKWGKDATTLSAHNQKVLKSQILRIMDLNNIKINSIVLKRKSKQDIHCPFVRRSIINSTHQRLARCAMHAHVWGGRFIPLHDDQWIPLYETADTSFPWTIESYGPCDGDDTEASLVVCFKDFFMGVAIADYIPGHAPHRTFLSFNSLDTIGVRFFSRYSVKIPMPQAIRTACQDDLMKLDLRLRGVDNYGDRQWAQLADPKHERRRWVEVHGFPLNHLNRVVADVRNIAEGEVIDCKEGTDTFKLLYGYGTKWVRQIRQEMSPRVLIIDDVMNQSVRIFGSSADVADAYSRIMMFTKQKAKLRINTKISLSRPRFLTSIRHAVSQEMLEMVTGGGSVTLGTNELEFSGTVEQAEVLNSYLETLNVQLLSCVPGSPSSRPECPVCLCPVPDANYCLEACGHYYCLTCITFKLSSSIRSRELPIKCDYAGCETPFFVNDIKKLFTGRSSATVPLWFYSDRYLPFIRSSLDCLIRSSNDVLQPCQAPDCLGIFSTRLLNRSSGSVSCSACGKARCAKCPNEPHDPHSCETYAKIRGDSSLSLELYKTKNHKDIRTCPNIQCQALIEREQGCNHMQCSFCKNHYCWSCGYMGKTIQEVYTHMNQKCGTNGGWVIENNVVLAMPAEEEADRTANDFELAQAMQADENAGVPLAFQQNHFNRFAPRVGMGFPRMQAHNPGPPPGFEHMFNGFDPTRTF